MASASKLHSYSDVSVHNIYEDCWVIINSKFFTTEEIISAFQKNQQTPENSASNPPCNINYWSVYNVTNFLSKHPGGDGVLLESAGKDASDEFEDVGHGSAARLMLAEFYVGEVDPSSHETMSKVKRTASPGPVTAIKGKPLESTNDRLIYFLLAFTIIMSPVHQARAVDNKGLRNWTRS